MKALIIVDLQNDFISGSLAINESSSIIDGINKLVSKYDVVIATQDSHPKNHYSFASTHSRKVGELVEDQVMWPDHCVKGTEGEKLHQDLSKDVFIVKKGEDIGIDSYSGFFDNNKNKTKLDMILKTKGVTEIDIVGLALDYCVKFTAIDGFNLGYKVNVIKELTKAVNIKKTDGELAILEMKNIGIGV